MTVLVVSHSTSFLDDICSDILHYENQKLVNYPGNLSNFVRQRPEAKHYYELSTDNLVFNFPVPGRLDGVSSRTQAIIKMEDVTFTVRPRAGTQRSGLGEHHHITPIEDWRHRVADVFRLLVSCLVCAVPRCHEAPAAQRDSAGTSPPSPSPPWPRSFL